MYHLAVSDDGDVSSMGFAPYRFFFTTGSGILSDLEIMPYSSIAEYPFTLVYFQAILINNLHHDLSNLECHGGAQRFDHLVSSGKTYEGIVATATEMTI